MKMAYWTKNTILSKELWNRIQHNIFKPTIQILITKNDSGFPTASLSFWQSRYLPEVLQVYCFCEYVNFRFKIRLSMSAGQH